MNNLFYINNDWDNVLKEEFLSENSKKLAQTLKAEYDNYTVFPAKEMIFSSLKAVDYSDVKVCILGQDPYHGAGQANGMAFAVCQNIPFPPSLLNIFKELKDDLAVPIPKNGTLTGWARQGVLLLNATLTVRESRPLSHANIGWSILTDAIIKALSNREKPLVFILWGANAIAKSHLIAPRHKVITSVHPSPLSASRGFFGSKPFSKTNLFLIEQGLKPIDWAIINDKEKEPTISININVPQNNLIDNQSSALQQSVKNKRYASYYNNKGTITKI